ncbi:MAG: hypothetical protein HQK54_11470, partial [Oligoflexales bacterium]|nr:hypothetical protein [Oligoflexales bacterium]
GYFDWKEIYRDLYQGTKKEKGQIYEASYNNQLGELCRQKLDDPKAAVVHYYRVLELGWLEPDAYHFMKEYYLGINDSISLTNCLKLRLKQTSKSEHTEVLKDLVTYSNDILSPQEIDYYAVLLMKEDESAETAVKKRIAYYEGKDDLDGIYGVVFLIDTHVGSDFLKSDWVHYCCEAYANTGSPRKYEYIERLYHNLFNTDEDKITVAKKAISLLEGADSPELLEKYVLYLFDEGVIPEISEDKVLKVLSKDKKNLVQYLEIKCFSAKDTAESVRYAEKILEEIDGKEEFCVTEYKLLMNIAQQKVLDDAKIGRLYELVRENGNWSEFFDLIQKQIKLISDKNLTIRLWRIIVEICDDILPDAEKVMTALNEIMSLSDHPMLVRYEIVEYLRKIGNVGQAREHAIICLRDSNTWRYLDILEKLFGFMVYEWNEMKELETIAISKIEELYKVGNIRSASKIGELLDNHGINNPQIAWISLEFNSRQRDADGTIGSWYRVLSLLNDKKDVAKFITSTEMLFERTKNTGLMDMIVNNYVKLNRLPRFLPADIEAELKVITAIKFFENGKDPEYTLSVLHNHYIEHPKDERVWVPLYFLLKDSGRSNELKVLLEDIIPKLEEDSKALAKFPVTLELMREEIGEKAEAKEEEREQEESHDLMQMPSLSETQLVDTGVGQDTIRFDNSIAEEASMQKREDYSQENPKPAGKNKAARIGDWRNVVYSLDFQEGMTENVINEAFENELDKHLAVQAFAMISGEYHSLINWNYRVWRYPDEVAYPLDIGNRIDEEYFTGLKKGHLYQLMSMLSPVMIKVFSEKFSLSSLAKKLGVSTLELISARRPVNWVDPYFDKTLFKKYAQFLNKNKITIFSVNRLGKKIFFDHKYRGIYFDASYYMNIPPTHLFHGVMMLIKSFVMQYYMFLDLDTVNEIIPFIEECRTALTQSRLSGFMMAVGLERNPLTLALNRLDRNKLQILFENLARIEEHQINRLKANITKYLLFLEMAETLDLIGLAEYTADMNLIEKGKIGFLDLVDRNPNIKRLLEFSTKLKI